jgi:hypothetical protein
MLEDFDVAFLTSKFDRLSNSSIFLRSEEVKTFHLSAFIESRSPRETRRLQEIRCGSLDYALVLQSIVSFIVLLPLLHKVSLLISNPGRECGPIHHAQQRPFFAS